MRVSDFSASEVLGLLQLDQHSAAVLGVQENHGVAVRACGQQANNETVGYTAIFVWIDGFSFSALIGSKIFGKIPRISIESGLRRIFHFGWDFTSENHFSNHFSMGSHSTK